jgi:hypothetical protein
VSPQKLLLLHVSSTGLMVSLLAIHFPSDELTKARAELERRGRDYSHSLAELIAREGTSAIDSVARTAEVSNVFLLTAAADDAPLPAVTEPYTLEFEDRIAFVRSVAGARGTLIVELSTQRLTRARTEMTRTAVAGGFASLVLGLMLAFALRRFERALVARAARERALEVVLRAPPANDTEPESHARTG